MFKCPECGDKIPRDFGGSVGITFKAEQQGAIILE